MRSVADIKPAKLDRAHAFSLVELLVVLAVTGILLFFAFPNIVQIKSDSERELAKARAEALNLAATAYFQALGPEAAREEWADASSPEEHYGLLRPYLAFPATTLSNFLPSADYSISFDSTAPHKVKATLMGPLMGGAITNIPY